MNAREKGLALVRALPRIRLLASATPLNLRAELTRLSAAWKLGHEEAPQFLNGPPQDLSAERAALAKVAEGTGGSIDDLCAARAAELTIEASACEAAFTPAFWGIARKRYPRRDAFDDAADALAPEWAALSPEVDTDDMAMSDDPIDRRSLLCAMRRAVGEHRIAFRIVVSRELSSLAATGPGAIYIASGRRISRAVAVRTVLHEVLGHALPASRAARTGVPLLEAGTAFGSDDQEGRALVIEEREGFLDSGRRRELGLRHLASRSVEARADLVSTVRMLLARGAGVDESLRIAARVHRGGGLARESVYLPAYLRVTAALALTPKLDDTMATGRISVHAARILAARRFS